MRKILAVGTVIAATALGACDATTTLDAEGLAGTWTARSIEYTSTADSATRVDLVARDGASFSLVVDADGTASTVFDDGVGGTSSDSGTLDGTETTLTLGGQTFDAVRSGDELVLTDPDDEFDFGSGSAVPAILVIELTR